MTTNNESTGPPRDAGPASGRGELEWVENHIDRFKAVRPTYELFSSFLSDVLTQAKRGTAPAAIVEARPKSIPSFAEKILRKRSSYQKTADGQSDDPLARMTDLAGARVVTQTAAEVRKVCQFIEAAFDVDWPNSEDVSQRLKPTEFGYRSVHYIVRVDSKKLKGAGITVEVPAELAVSGALTGGQPPRAEIQVRTLLEHAAAALGHDSLYKTEIEAPDRIKRHHATLAAMLEDVDTGFGRLMDSIKELETNAGAHYGRQALADEIDRQRLVLRHDRENLALVSRIARLALAGGRHETALEVLKPYRERKDFGVERWLGQALTEIHWFEPKHPGFVEGRALLRAACARPPVDSETLAILADCEARDDDAERARELFHRAIQADASDPLTLSRYLEFEIAHARNDGVVRLSTPMITAAIQRCSRQIEGKVNLPAAWSSLALFRLLVGRPYESLDAIANLAALCEFRVDGAPEEGGACGTPGRPCSSGRALSRLRDALRRLRCIQKDLEGFDWCERAVALALAVRVGEPEARRLLEELSSWEGGGPRPFGAEDKCVILAGACADELQSRVAELKPHLLRGCEGLSFKVVSGGTTDGMSGLAGDLAGVSAGKIVGVGYLPKHLPRTSREDTYEGRYASRFCSSGTDFTPMEPLQGWTDLVAAGVHPARVRVLVYAPGRIARVEAVMALALGARVGTIENAALPEERRFLDPSWKDNPNLVRLPMDAMTLRAFLVVEDLPLDLARQTKWEKAARKAHEEYLASSTPSDPSMRTWEELDPALKLSNYHQVLYWEQMLAEHGLGVRELNDTDLAHEPLKMEEVLGRDVMLKLAEMEHGRWNVERLLRGWRHDETKDVALKLNPCVAPWTGITNIHGQNYQTNDEAAIRTLPSKFREAGLEVYKL